MLEGAGVPSAPVNTIEHVMQDRQLQSRNMFVTVQDDKAGAITIPGNPIKMESIPESTTRPSAPEIGEHTEHILRGVLGLGDREIAALHAEGAI